jgi:DNA-binding transcriptional MocR family regulator
VRLFSDAIVRHFPAGTRISRPQGGFVLWVEMPARFDTKQLHAAALRARINIAPGLLFSPRERYQNCLRMNCGLPWNEEIENAVRKLGDLAHRQS